MDMIGKSYSALLIIFYILWLANEEVTEVFTVLLWGS